MKKTILLFSLFISLCLFSAKAHAQVDKIVGTWQTIDDKTGKAKSHVKIFEATNGYYYGKIVKLIDKDPNTKCTNCKGDLKDQPIVGMLIITRMKPDGDNLEDGKIMDPNNGEYYYCTLKIDENDDSILNVRGSIDSWGFAGRTQTWHRL